MNQVTALPIHRGLFRFLDRLEETLLCLMLTAMILLACTQIGLRTFFSSGLLWADPLLRYLVLWCGLLGAVTATSRNKHIAIDIVGARLPGSIEHLLVLLTHLFCMLSSAGLTWASYLFLVNEIEFGGPGLFAIPSWGWYSIFPIAFGLISFKYFSLFLLQIRIFFRRPHLSDRKKTRP